MKNKNFKKNDYKIAVIGLGYIGATLAFEFSKKINTVGFDISLSRVNQLNKNFDKNLEINFRDLSQKNKKKIFTNNRNELKDSNVYILTVPTPVNKKNEPDLKAIKNAINIISKFIKRKDIIVLESTVYPGLTEGIFRKYIEEKSKLKFNEDFFLGYSPERVNPGDKKNNLKNVTKIVSGSDLRTTKILSNLYNLICNKIHTAENIIIAESAKIIENCQRDINIAFMNELQIYFDKINIDVNKVLNAASTKWNFLNFHPGLVGGHCIGVDPYYLLHEFKRKKIKSKIIKNARNVNQNMTKYFLKKILFFFKKNKIISQNNKIIIIGATFKENCPDQRNSKNIDLALYLDKLKFTTTIVDPYIKKIETNTLNKIKILKKYSLEKINQYDAAIFAVPHTEFLKNNFYKNIKIPKLKLREF